MEKSVGYGAVHASVQVCFNAFFVNRVTFMELSSLGRGSRAAIDAPQN